MSLDKAITIFCCKDRTLTYSAKGWFKKIKSALPVFSVDTIGEAEALVVCVSRAQYHEHPDMPGDVWYKITLDGQLDFKRYLDVEDLEAVTAKLTRVHATLTNPVPKFRRGFSCRSFQRGDVSEHDKAVTIVEQVAIEHLRQFRNRMTRITACRVRAPACLCGPVSRQTPKWRWLRGLTGHAWTTREAEATIYATEDIARRALDCSEYPLNADDLDRVELVRVEGGLRRQWMEGVPRTRRRVPA